MVAPQPETLKELRETSLERLGEGGREVEACIAPYRLSGGSITFAGGVQPLSVGRTMILDDRPGVRELGWLRTVLEKKLAETIELQVGTKPLLPPIGFTQQDELDGESRAALNRCGRCSPVAGLPYNRRSSPRRSLRASPADTTSCQVERLTGQRAGGSRRPHGGDLGEWNGDQGPGPRRGITDKRKRDITCSDTSTF